MQDFFQNVSRYPRFLISISLGIFWAFFEKLVPFLKNPVTAVALIGFGVGTFVFLYLTLEAMLGIN
jgi:type II secretory pathway component PulF